MHALRDRQLAAVCFSLCLPKHIYFALKIWDRFNSSDTNPLALDRERQVFVGRKKLHTHMCVGDCVEFEWDGRFELWAFVGWKMISSGEGKVIKS